MDPLERALEMLFEERSRSPGAESSPDAAGDPKVEELLAVLRSEAQPRGSIDGERTFGDFRLKREVGRGGMAVVYEAMQVPLGRKVAVKLLHEARGADPASVARLRLEAETLARLEHPGIVKVLAVGSEQGVPYVAMEWIDGEPLRADRLPRRAVVDVAAQVADALEHAHRSGVVHRDVKPQNVMLRRDGTALLTDFGLARIAGGPGLTQSGAFAGTPCYAAPEQVDPAVGEVGPHTDTYALGATLYELLTARRPFEGPSTQAVLHQVVTRDPSHPLRLCPDLPVELGAIVLKAMEKSPARRYASAAALGADLRAWLANRPVSARPPTLIVRLRKFVQREPFRAAALALVVVGVPTVAALGGYLVAMQPALREGAEKLRHDRLEHLLAEAFFEVQEGDAAQARRMFEAVLTEQPKSPEAELGLELVASRREPKPSTTPAAEEPVEAAQLALAGLRTMGHCHTATDATYRRALHLLREAVVRSPAARLLYHAQWAHAAGHARDAAQARSAAAALQQMWPQSKLAWRWSAFALGKVAPAEAVPCWRRALALGPESYDARKNLARILFAAGQRDEAIERAKLLVRDHPDMASAWHLLGDVQWGNGRQPEALASFARAVELVRAGPQPDTVVANLLANYGVARVQSDDAAGAVPLLAEAVSLEQAPGPFFARYLWALLLSDRHDELNAICDRTVADPPADPVAMEQLVDCLNQLGRADDAVAALERRCERDPENARMHEALAVQLLSARRRPELLARALEPASRAVLLDRGCNAGSLLVLARAQHVAGQPDRALDSIAQARRYLPADAVRRQEMERALADLEQRCRQR